MPVAEYIKTRREKGPLHFTLIDPDKQEPQEAGKLAKFVEDSGSDAIMVGGSWGDIFGDRLNKTILEIKKSCKLPVILFSSSAQHISEHADALFFMSLFNSRSVQYVITEQAKAAIYVKKIGIEPLSMAYLIFDCGSNTAAGWVGDAKLIPTEKPEIPAAYALAAKYFGMKIVYLEGGSGAKFTVPARTVAAVKKAVGDDMLVIVGGGIRDPETAKEKVKAGADIIVTGTIAEENREKLKEIIKAIKE